MRTSTSLTTILAVITAFALGAATSWAQPYTFADIPWGSTRAQVKQLLTGKGFVIGTENDGGKDTFEFLAFSGMLLGHHISGGVMFVDARCAKLALRIATPDEKAIPVYVELTRSLKAKYGEPTMVRAEFTRPYELGDGYELQAIRLKKAKIFTAWRTNPGDEYGNSLMVSITENLAVDVTYETPAWEKAFESLREKESSLF